MLLCELITGVIQQALCVTASATALQSNSLSSTELIWYKELAYCSPQQETPNVASVKSVCHWVRHLHSFIAVLRVPFFQLYFWAFLISEAEMLCCLNFLFSWEAKKKKMNMLAKSDYPYLINSFSFSMRSSKQMKILFLLPFVHPNQCSQLALLSIHKSFCDFYLLPRSGILCGKK